MTQFVIVIDAAIVNVALPSIGSALHFARDDLSWVVNAYTLTFGGFLLLGGRLADLMGRRRMFMLGLVLFSLASLAGGLAQSEGWLIAARAVQGLGGGDRLAGGSVDHHDHVRGGGRAQPRTRDLGRGRRRRRRRRGAAGRDPDQRSELALGPVRERPDRDRGSGDGPANARREPRRRRHHKASICRAP